MKIISKHTFMIINACKRDDLMESLVNYLKAYLALNELSDEIIYYHLLETIYNVLDYDEIKKIFLDDIRKINYYNYIRENRDNITISDLIDLFYKRIMLLDMNYTETIMENGIPQIRRYDIYYVNENNKLIAYSDYMDYAKIKKLCNKLN